MARRRKWRIDGHMCQTWFGARVVEYRVEPLAAKFADRRSNLGLWQTYFGPYRKSLRGL